ncbi:MAG: nitroreductase family protein [Candidatus Omnitrophica bacterium]|nr:nitroreductase family protein [Candidatus Omnitrophota bacterium]
MTKKNILSLFTDRYSCRAYDIRPVEKEKLDAVMAAACMAPSACNKQPWRYFVITETKLLDELRQKAFGPPVSNKFVKEAPVLIAVGVKKDLVVHGIVPAIKGIPYQFIDVGISTDHLMLQATELGLATCWLGWFNIKAAEKILKLPSDIKLCGLISLGYPKDEPPQEKQRRPVNDTVRFIT